MSAICGIYDNTNKKPLPPNALAATMAAIAHYGRDGSHTWQSGAITLGHQMTFSTTESLREKLPSSLDENQKLIITADARIDNRAELIPLLALPPAISDSQLILGLIKNGDWIVRKNYWGILPSLYGMAKKIAFFVPVITLGCAHFTILPVPSILPSPPI